MSWREQIFRYCERGVDTGLLAEPLNVLSSLAYLVVAGFAARRLLQPSPAAGTVAFGETGDRSTEIILTLLVALTAAIGLGSLLFHLTATRWAQIADVAPITLFMLLYLALALHVLFGVRWPIAGLGVLAFAALLYLSGRVCQPDSAVGALGRACLNDSARYIPALVALGAVGWLLRTRAHPAASRILAAAAIFLLALLLRTLDVGLCWRPGLLWSRPLGLHFLWHLLTALTLYLVLGAAIAAVRGHALAPQALR